ncbi:hypothetical protein TWF694_009493 [Orbilia ellipsospora]|uniref:Clr5 domain-containing protein n=1 Tax=Orbilia ellipsospora TaxID=2528407 RepID=A0AAV9XAZ0_9PEZI
MLPKAVKNHGVVRSPKCPQLDSHREEIEFLYCVEQIPMNELIRYMNETYGLNATYYQYRDRLAKWGFRKRLKAREWKDINMQMCILKRGSQAMSDEFEVHLNEITEIGKKRLKRGLARNISSLDNAFVNARLNYSLINNALTASLHGELGSRIRVIALPPATQDILIPTPHDWLPFLIFKNIFNSRKEDQVNHARSPQIIERDDGSRYSNPTSSTFLGYFVYHVSNNMTHEVHWDILLDEIEKLGYREALKSALSQNSITTRILCEKLVHLLYLRKDHELLQTIREYQLETWRLSFYGVLKNILFFRYIEFGDDLSDPDRLRESKYEASDYLPELLMDIFRYRVPPKTLNEAYMFLQACLKVDHKGLSFLWEIIDRTLLEPWFPELLRDCQKSGDTLLGSKFLKHITADETDRIQLLLDIGLKDGICEGLLRVIVLNNLSAARAFSQCVWDDEYTFPPDSQISLAPVWDSMGLHKFKYIFCEAVAQYGAADSTHQTQQSENHPSENHHDGVRPCFSSVYKHQNEPLPAESFLTQDILPNILAGGFTEHVLWELKLASYLIILNPTILDFLLELFLNMHPTLDVALYFFHIILARYWSPEVYYLHDIYGPIDRPNAKTALQQLILRGVDMRATMDFPLPPIACALRSIRQCHEYVYHHIDVGDEQKEIFTLEETDLQPLELLIDNGADINAAFTFPGEESSTLPIIFVFKMNMPREFCYLLSRGVHLPQFLYLQTEKQKAFGGKFPPQFIEACHRRDTEYILRTKAWSQVMEIWGDSYLDRFNPLNYGFQFITESLDMSELGWQFEAMFSGRSSTLENAREFEVYISQRSFQDAIDMVNSGFMPSTSSFGVLIKEVSRLRKKLDDQPHTQEIHIVSDDDCLLKMGIELINMIIEWKINPCFTFELNLLESAIANDDVIIMNQLLSLGLNPSKFRSSKPRRTAIQFAAGTSTGLYCLRELVDRGGDVNEPPCPRSEGGGLTALHEAIEKNNIPAVVYLLHKGADIYATDVGSIWERPLCSLELAIRKQRIDAIAIILQANPVCQSFALEVVEKLSKADIYNYTHSPTIHTYIRDWKPVPMSQNERN